MGFRFNQIVFSSLSEKMKLEKVSFAEELKSRDSFNKEKSMKVELYNGYKIEKIVLAEIQALDFTETHNGIIYPGEGYDFPIFDFMLGSFGDGLLVSVEFYPLRRDKTYMEKYIAPMEELYQKAGRIPEPMENPFEWMKEFTSGQTLLLGSSDEYMQKIEEVFKDYLDLWLGYVKEAEPVSDPILKDNIIDFKKRFRRTFRKNDPGKDSLYRNFGEEWTERYYREVIYV